MSIKAIIYDIEIDILKIHYDPVLLKLKKDLHLSISKIKNLFFSSQFYFFTIGKLNFENFIKTSFNELMLDSSYISKIEKKYKKSFEYFSEKKNNLIILGNILNISIYFSADIDSSIANSLIKKDPSINKISFFSSKINAVKQENYFMENIINQLGLDSSNILIVDDNLDVLIAAKEFGFFTLFYDGKRDFYELLSIINQNID